MAISIPLVLKANTCAYFNTKKNEYYLRCREKHAIGDNHTYLLYYNILQLVSKWLINRIPLSLYTIISRYQRYVFARGVCARSSSSNMSKPAYRTRPNNIRRWLISELNEHVRRNIIHITSQKTRRVYDEEMRVRRSAGEG